MKNSYNFELAKAFENIEFLSNQLVEGFITGLHKSPYHGFSVEFSEHQPYNTGENIKNIDWKIYAKTDKLFTKKFEEETNLRAQLVIDNSSSMYYPKPSNDKMAFSITAAACLAQILHRQKDAVGLFSFDQTLKQHTHVKSSKIHLKHLLACLQNLPKESVGNRTNLPKILHELSDKIHQRSLIILFSDFQVQENELTSLFQAFQHIKYNNHELLIFHVQDKKTESDFEFENRPYEFIDLESSGKLQLETSQVIKEYQNAYQSFIKKIALKAGQFKLDYNLVDAQQDIFHTMSQFFLKRKKM